MVTRLTIGKKKYAAVENEMQEILTRAEELRAELTSAIARDAAAFEAVMAAIKLPKDTPEGQSERARSIEAATLEAARVPLEVAGKAVEVLGLAARVVTDGNLNAISDGASASALARASLAGAGYNVRINVASLTNPGAAQDLLEQLRQLEGHASDLEAQVRETMTTRGGISLE